MSEYDNYMKEQEAAEACEQQATDSVGIRPSDEQLDKPYLLMDSVARGYSQQYASCMEQFETSASGRDIPHKTLEEKSELIEKLDDAFRNGNPITMDDFKDALNERGNHGQYSDYNIETSLPLYNVLKHPDYYISDYDETAFNGMVKDKLSDDFDASFREIADAIPDQPEAGIQPTAPTQNMLSP